MIAWLSVGLLFGVGVTLLLLSQPLGRREPPLRERLQGLTAAARDDAARRALDAGLVRRITLGPLIEVPGAFLARALGRLGFHGSVHARQLELTGDSRTLAQLRGQQLLFAAVTALGVLVLTLIAPLPLVAAPLLAFAAALVPPYRLGTPYAERRAGVASELPAALQLLSMKTASGLTPERALRLTARQLPGPLGQGLMDVLDEAGTRGRSLTDGLILLAAREQDEDLRALANAWERSERQGLVLAVPLRNLAARHLRRRREQLLASGSQRTQLMMLPSVLLLLPATMVAMLYPALGDLLAFLL